MNYSVGVLEMQWLRGNDTGTSSETIFNVFTGVPLSRFGADVPYDPSDFGRCYRLLKLFPQWRANLSRVSDKYPRWTGLVENWKELEMLYERDLQTGRSEELYKRIKELIAR